MAGAAPEFGATLPAVIQSEVAPRALVSELATHLRGRRVVALTGAGVSTESGIPDYRSPEASTRTRRPIHGPEFVRLPEVRRRYWARAMVGWERFGHARPGAAHLALATLEASGVVTGVITQNVDRLHRAAGSRRVVELHGALAEVLCLECGALYDRNDVQRRMRHDNRLWLDGAPPMAADGDAELAEEAVAAFQPPSCPGCGGALKPRVVFFGENVARELVEGAVARLDEADALLVAGTSLAVFSGYRFLRRAVERGMTIAIVNRGPVRGEEHAAIKIEGSTGAVLQELALRLA
jgi:NAD-dependent SIR2 family protein deacetylase